ncbi:biotin [Cyclospora cayetanensis]|uniref:Biotin n=1 Tax=Cyclospora cayetanensis TaxID=88456 RepID=A0A1D3D682_9EIME|nr:biotin [Cyclospora cayetanensis]
MTGKAGARDPPEIEASAAVELHPRHSMTGDVAVAAARVREVSVGAPLAVTELSFDSLDSTQKWAERHLDELVGETGEERRWVSSAGNLHATYVLQWPLQHQPLLLHLPFVAALSVLRVLQQLGIEGAHIKWVNDVLVGNKKIAGVLCQNTNRAVSVAGAAGAATAGSAPENVVAAAGSAQRDALLVLVGIGINIAKHPRGPMTDCCYQGSTDLVNEGFCPIRSVVARHLAFKGELVSVVLDQQQQQQEEKYSGVLEGLGPDGALLLRLPNGSLKAFCSGRLLRG